MSRTGIVRDNRYMNHQAGAFHPESPQRLKERCHSSHCILVCYTTFTHYGVATADLPLPSHDLFLERPFPCQKRHLSKNEVCFRILS
jgi:hypothetical protein